MAKIKITLDELRGLVKQIIKEEFVNMPDEEFYILRATNNIPEEGPYYKGMLHGRIHFTNDLSDIISVIKGRDDAEDRLRFFNEIFPKFEWVLVPFSN